MKSQLLYKNLAKYYDLIYAKKDYKKEAQIIKGYIKKYAKIPVSEVLEVACGTGNFLQYLEKDFIMTGTDINRQMLAIAKQKTKKTKLKQADMIDFSLGKKFDAILCLFSSIGYVKTYANLEKTINNFARHLKPGGVLIIQPWLTKAIYKVGKPNMDFYEDDNLKIARLSVAEAKGNLSFQDMHYVIAHRDKKVQHFVDRHELGMFEVEKTISIMEKAGFKVKYIKGDLNPKRGLYIAVKKSS